VEVWIYLKDSVAITGSKNLHKKREPAWKLEELRKKRRWAYVHNIVYRYRPYCTAY
jgi:hypothetical protein